jgi:nicotinamidase-related amidase
MTSATFPKTLFEFAGASPRPASFKEGVLAVIDAQNEYVSGKLPLKGIGAAIAEASRLLALARAAGTPVIHIVHHAAPGRPVFAKGSHGAAIIAELSPLTSEEVIAKALPNAFAGTGLAKSLERFKANGRNSLILAGFMTHNCVSSTARAALDFGIPVTVVASATATRDLPGVQGDIVAAEVVQAASLAALADRTAAVVYGPGAFAESA